jgi:hypothetical protein
MIQSGEYLNDFQYVYEGKEVSLKETLTANTTLVVWLRHLGCRFYEEALLKLPALDEALKREGMRLVVIVQADEEEAAIYFPKSTFAYVCDPHKVTYKDAKIGKTTWFQILFPTKGLKERRKEANAMGCSINVKRAKLEHSDPLQLSGMALVDPDMRVKWSYESKHTGDLDLSESLVKTLLPYAI